MILPIDICVRPVCLPWRPGRAHRTRKRRPRLPAPGPALLPVALRRETLCKIVRCVNHVQLAIRLFEEDLRQIGAAPGSRHDHEGRYQQKEQQQQGECPGVVSGNSGHFSLSR